MISIIVPVYNGENFVMETLNSIKAQTYTDFEVLVCDDGSSDNTRELVESLSKEDSRFNFVALEHQGAPGHARNAGLRLAKGEYVLYFDSDDKMEPNMLTTLLASMDENTDLVIGNVRYYNVVTKCVCDNEMQAFFNKETYTYNDLFTINPFPCNKLYRKSFLLDSNVWYLEKVFNQDLGYFLCLVMHRPRFKVVKDVVMEYRIRPNSITTSKKTMKKHLDILHVYEQVFAEYEKLDVKDMEYGLYEMFIKTMIFKVSFFDLTRDLKEVNMIRDYLYKRVPDWYKREEYLNYYSFKKRVYNTILLRFKCFKLIGKYKQLKRGE